MSLLPPDEQRKLAESAERIEMCVRRGGTQLSLGGLGLTALPERVRRLTDLEVLDIRRNHIVELPEWLQGLRLREIHWLGNGPVRIPPWLPNLRRLEFLNIGRAEGIQGLSILGEAKSLRQLWLEEMTVGEVPASLRGAAHLKKLYFIRTALTSLPDWIGEWTALETLDLDHNALTTLPATLSRLSNLRTLLIQYNRLRSLPPGLIALKQLDELYLGGNPLGGMPAELIATRDARRIFAHCRNLR
jgi:Leucine-rich repeat (LRR) protein